MIIRDGDGIDSRIIQIALNLLPLFTPSSSSIFTVFFLLTIFSFLFHAWNFSRRLTHSLTDWLTVLKRDREGDEKRSPNSPKLFAPVKSLFYFFLCITLFFLFFCFTKSAGLAAACKRVCVRACCPILAPVYKVERKSAASVFKAEHSFFLSFSLSFFLSTVSLFFERASKRETRFQASCTGSFDRCA